MVRAITIQLTLHDLYAQNGRSAQSSQRLDRSVPDHRRHCPPGGDSSLLWRVLVERFAEACPEWDLFERLPERHAYPRSTGMGGQLLSPLPSSDDPLLPAASRGG